MRALWLIAVVALAEAGTAADWAKVECPDPKVLAAEILAAEAGGWRVPGAKSACFAQENFKYISGGAAAPLSVVEPVKSPLILDDVKPFSILDVQPAGGGLWTVRFRLHPLARGGGGRGDVEDSLMFQTYAGAMKRDAGCADLVVEPTRFFIRKSCR